MDVVGHPLPRGTGYPAGGARAVFVHGDACSPNTLHGADGLFAANVDLGDAAVGDRWGDLAVATMSLEWNFGPGWDRYFFDAYGIVPDPTRIAYYQALYRVES